MHPRIRYGLITLPLMAAFVGGCKSASDAPATQPSLTSTSTEPAIAIVNGQPIAKSDLTRPIIQAYGLNFLLDLVQLSSVQQAAVKNNVTVSEADVQAEMKKTLDAMFRDNSVKNQANLDAAIAKGQTDIADAIRKQMLADDDQLLDQFLGQQRISKQEFEIVIRTNTYLRKIVEPTTKGAITEKMLEDGFRFQYGEKVVVRHIQCANMAEIGKARQRLAAGESFEDVARAVSRNLRDAPDGGLLRPFSRQDPTFPEQFKSTAFDLKPGEVSSDVVNTNGSFQLIKLERRIDPVAVKFEDHKEIIRHELEESIVANGMKQLRAELAQDALKTLQINDADLRAQFDKKMGDAKTQIKGKDDTLKQLTQEREAAEAAAATQPAAGATTVPSSLPPLNAAPAQATMPASVPTTAPAR